MCSPVGHTLAALATGGYYKKLPLTWPFLAFCVISGNFPDLDLLLGWALGSINEYHHLGSHSLTAALLYGCAVYIVLRLANLVAESRIWWSVAGCTMYFSHILLDMLAFDGTEPIGVQLFWPFSDGFFASNPSLFPAFLHHTQGGDMAGMIMNMFNRHNLITIVFELCVLGPLMLIALWQRKGRS